MTKQFENVMSELTSQFFPQKTIIISAYDKPYFTEELRKMKRQRQRYYRRYGKNEKYCQLYEKFQENLKSEKLKYRDKILREVKEGRRGSSYAAFKKLAMRPDQHTDKSFILPSHIRDNLSPSQSTEAVANYFAAVSQEFLPLKLEKLPANVQSYLTHPPSKEIIPQLTDYDVFKKLRQAKKPSSQ